MFTSGPDEAKFYINAEANVFVNAPQQLRHEGQTHGTDGHGRAKVQKKALDEFEAAKVTLADESELPMPDGSMNRVLLVHAVESSEQLRPLLREVWRVLAGGGRLLVVVPNRRGIWARLERTPFGHGHPFSPPQLSRLLRESLFLPLNTETALYMPPSASPMMLRAAGAWESIGERWNLPFAGVAIIEASKQVYAANPERQRKRYQRIMGGAAPAHHRDITEKKTS